MNKKRTLLLVFLSLVCAFTLAFAVGCANPDDSLLQGNYQDEADEDIAAADEWVLQHITLNTSGITREYALGTAFNAEGKPEVTARFVSLQSLTESVENNGEEVQLITKDEIVPAGEVVMDYTQFDKDSVGEYSIYVSYTHAKVTRSASFNVNVLGVEPGNGGITVSKAVTTYSLGAGEATVAIALDDITVQRVSLNEQGDEVKEDIAAGEYELTFFKNGVTSITAEDMAAADKGAYTIIAKAGNFSAQLVVSVLNPVNRIELKTGDEIKTTQVQSPTESMSATWVFVVTYNNGETKEVKKGDAGLVIGPLVTVTAAERTVAVAYAEDDNTVTATVNYTITADAALLSEQKAFNRTALGITADADVTQAHLTGDNSFLVRGTGSKTVLKYRPGTDKGCLEIRYDALNIEFLGFGTLTVSARSTGAANKSAIALKDADGNYVTANYSDAQIEAGKTDKGEVYTVTGDMQKDAEGVIIPYAARILTFVIPKAGVYTLCTVDSVKVGETDVATGRNTRVYSIDKVDVFDATIDRVSYNFTINTDSVKKDYIAGETLDIQGLTASFNEVHSVDTEKNKQTDVTAEIEEPEITAGNLNDFGKKATVTIKYIKDGTEYSASYVINVASPVTGVNSVTAVKETKSYMLESAEATAVEISTADITFKANGATGSDIVLGEGETVTYKLFKGEEEQQSFSVGVGTYKIVATLVLNNTADGASGTTTFTAEITVTVNPFVEQGGAVDHTFTFNLTALADAVKGADGYVDKMKPTAADFTGDNAFLNFIGSTGDIRVNSDKTKATSFEIKGDAFEITFKGTGTLTLSFCSTGGSNTSDIAVKDAEGNFLTSITAGAVTDTNNAGYYTCTGTSAATLEFSITKAGKYIITACCDSTTGAVHARNTRVTAISMVDKYEDGDAPATPVPVKVNVSTLENIETLVTDTASANSTADIVLGEGVTVTSGVKFTANNYTFEGVSYTHRLQLNGAGSATAKSLKIEVKAGAKIKVVARSGGASARNLNLYDASGTKLTDYTDLSESGAVAICEYNATADGTYYVWGTNGFNVLTIEITYEAATQTANLLSYDMYAEEK